MNITNIHKSGRMSKKQLSQIIRIVTLVTSLIGVAGILCLTFCVHLLTDKYASVITLDSSDIEYVNEIGSEMYRHQSLTYAHMLTSDEQSKGELIESAVRIDENVNSVLEDFGSNMKGREYETYYHKIYSNVIGYLKNVNIIFELSGRGDIETARYYMDNSLEKSISDLNESIEEFYELTKQDMADARNELERGTDMIRVTAVVILAVIFVLTVFADSICSIISYTLLYEDSLTGVANSDKLLDTMSRLYKKGKLDGFTCICINIKDFNYINRQLGTKNADFILSYFAKQILSHLENDEIIARQNGDVFLLLIRKEHTEKLLEEISTYEIDINDSNENKNVIINSRCGVYEIESGIEPKEILKYTEIALEETRTAGKNCVFFTNEMFKRIASEKDVLLMFRKAIENREFVVYYQPKVDIKTNTICGCEALVRWVKDGKLVPPDSFIPILEKDGCIVELDLYVFDEVCKNIAEWTAKGINPVRVSSNFSKLHLKNNYFAEDLLEIINKHNIDKKYIETELTESSVYDDFDALTEFIKKMKNAKIKTSMDDFGTGYSSLSMLKDLDVDVVKLDKSFIDGIESGNAESEKMVENVINMVHDLNRSIICEGVETQSQADFLKSRNCYTVQGYLYDKPLTHDEFEKRLIHPKYENKEN